MNDNTPLFENENIPEIDYKPYPDMRERLKVRRNAPIVKARKARRRLKNRSKRKAAKKSTRANRK